MPEPAQDIPARIFFRALQGVEGIEDQLDELRHRHADREDLPGVTLLLRACLIVVDGLKRQLIEESRDLKDQTYAGPVTERQKQRAINNGHTMPLDSRIRAVASVQRFEALLRTRLQLLSEAHGQSFEALSGPFTRLAKALPGERDLELIFRPSPGTLYEIWFKVLDELQDFSSLRFGEDAGRVLERMPRLMVIEYPWHHERDTFLHAVIAHEIGHVAFVNNRVGNQVWLNTAAGRLDKDRAAGFRRWFIEFACDLLAVRMIGPAYVIALVEHTLGENVWFEPGSTAAHPPLPTRVAFLRDEVKRFFDGSAPQRESHGLALRYAEQTVERFFDMLPEDEGIPDDVQPVIADALAALLNADVLGAAEYDVTEFRSQFGPAWDALTNGVAPAEIVYGRDREAREEEAQALRSDWSEPCDWRSVLNAGYLRWLVEDQGTELPTLLRRGALVTRERIDRCAHIQGAIELCELHRAMLSQRAELGALEIPATP